LAVTAAIALITSTQAAAIEMSQILAMKGENPCLCVTNVCSFESAVCTGLENCCEQMVPGNPCSVVSLEAFQNHIGDWFGE